MSAWTEKFMGLADYRRHLLATPTGLVLLSGDDILVGIGDLKRAIIIARDLDLVILGMEGFMSDGSSVAALPEFIADLGAITGDWHERVARSTASALDIASKWQGGPEFIELVLEATDQHV